MKTFIAVIFVSSLIGCSTKTDPYPVLQVRDWDPNNNRVTEDGRLIPWTNFGIGFWNGTNWVKVLQAEEK